MNCSEKKERTYHSYFFHFPQIRNPDLKTLCCSLNSGHIPLRGGGNFKRNPKPLQVILPFTHVF